MKRQRSPRPKTPRPAAAFRRACALLALTASVAYGCSSSRPDAIAGVSGRNTTQRKARCDEGATRECSITLAEHADVLTCFQGAQTCTDGEWSECADGLISEMAVPGLGVLSLGGPKECTDNPCDASCRTYFEQPDEPIAPDEARGPAYDWETGSLSDLPLGLVEQGINEPCQTGADCQFNMRCEAPALGECAHSVCEAGDALDSECNSCAAMVCEHEASCCMSGASTWSDDCVAIAETMCDVTCDGDESQGSSGTCVPWYPGETDPSCATVDLAVGIPCDNVIPVCNHGNATATGPIELSHWPANSQHPTCSPDLADPKLVTCTLSEDIPPGECVNLDSDSCVDLDGDAAPLDNESRVMMVNPRGNTEECSCLDNWSFYVGGNDCNPPSCAGGRTRARSIARPVDVIIIVDNSESMGDEIAEVQARIHSDLAQTLEDSGLDYRVIVVSRFGDLDVPEGPSRVPICIGAPLGATSCADASNETLVNNAPIFYHHSTDIESWDSWCQLLGGYDESDEVGITDAMWNGEPGAPRPWNPVNPDGWGSRLRTEAFKHFVLITDDDIECSDYGYDFDDTPGCDGFPHDCHDLPSQRASSEQMAQAPIEAQKFDDALLALSPAQFGTAANRKYAWHSIVNIKRHPDGDRVPYRSEEPLEDEMCTAPNTSLVGAGVAYQALSRLTGGLRYPICENQDFDAIFNVIAEEVIETSVVSCEFALRDDASFDPGSASVSWTEGDDDKTSLRQVRTIDDCGSSETSWYYDDPDAPSTVTLCPSTCQVVQDHGDAQVWVEIGCPQAEPTTVTHTYFASCDAGQKPQWMFMYYDTTIEAASDATATFSVRSAVTETGLSRGNWHEAATATGDQPDCSKGVPVEGSCPVDLYSLLGPVEAKRDYLELEVALKPVNDIAPSLEDWELTYSCPPDD